MAIQMGKARRMTIEDYLEANVVPPPGTPGYRPGMLFTAAQRRHEALAETIRPNPARG